MNRFRYTVQDARNKVLSAVKRLSAETIEVSEACGRVCAENILVNENIPSREISLRDGYAVNSKDLASECALKSLEIARAITAGDIPGAALEPGTCVRITTGAPVPDGADSVIPYEDVSIRQNKIFVEKEIGKGQFVMKSGDIARSGDIVAKTGAVLTPMTISAIVDTGRAYVKVVRRPRVGILVTGNEVVEPDVKRKDQQVYCSNRYLLGALARNYGGEEIFLGIRPDSEKEILSVLEAVHGCDCVVISGGTGKGEHDCVKGAWKKAGVDILFDGVSMHPGRSTACGIRGGVLYFSLPGNPLASGLAFVQFVSVALLNMAGRNVSSPPCTRAILAENLRLKGNGVERFFWGRTTCGKGELKVMSAGTEKKRFLQKIAGANCVIASSSKERVLKKGETVTVQPVCLGLDLSYLTFFYS